MTNSNNSFGATAGKIIHIIVCFLIMYTTLIIFLIPICLTLVARLIISIILAIFYEGNIKLVECANASFCVDRFANVFTISYYICIDGPCDINLLRRRLHQKFVHFEGKRDSSPYEVMLCNVKQMFGFFCWENNRNNFDINHHVRYLPGCSDPTKVYSESEVFDAAGLLIDQLWDENKPRWEFLVVPKVLNRNTGKICSAIHFRFHHAYVDGMSAVQILRLCIADKPTELIFDPVNPPGIQKSLSMQIFMYLQVFFLGPWAVLRYMSYKGDHVLYEGELKGNKIFGRSTTVIPINTMRKIRKKYNCSTSAVQHYAISGAIGKVAKSKGIILPKTALGILIFALLPYSNEYPQNQVTFGMDCFPMTGANEKENIEDRLKSINKACQNSSSPMNYYALVTSKLMLFLVGMFPVAIAKGAHGSLDCLYVLSNVPGTKEPMYFDGKEVINAFGSGPLMNKVRYSTGILCYDNQFTFGFYVEKSLLINNREDLDDLIGKFDNEINQLMDSVKDADGG